MGIGLAVQAGNVSVTVDGTSARLLTNEPSGSFFKSNLVEAASAGLVVRGGATNLAGAFSWTPDYSPAAFLWPSKNMTTCDVLDAAGSVYFNSSTKKFMGSDGVHGFRAFVREGDTNYVGIGTNAPSEALEVAGTVKATGLKVGANQVRAIKNTTNITVTVEADGSMSLTGSAGGGGSFDTNASFAWGTNVFVRLPWIGDWPSSGMDGSANSGGFIWYSPSDDKVMYFEGGPRNYRAFASEAWVQNVQGTNYAAWNHNHDATYSLLGHDHAGVYATPGDLTAAFVGPTMGSAVVTTNLSVSTNWFFGYTGATNYLQGSPGSADYVRLVIGGTNATGSAVIRTETGGTGSGSGSLSLGTQNSNRVTISATGSLNVTSDASPALSVRGIWNDVSKSLLYLGDSGYGFNFTRNNANGCLAIKPTQSGPGFIFLNAADVEQMTINKHGDGVVSVSGALSASSFGISKNGQIFFIPTNYTAGVLTNFSINWLAATRQRLSFTNSLQTNGVFISSVNHSNAYTLAVNGAVTDITMSVFNSLSNAVPLSFTNAWKWSGTSIPTNIPSGKWLWLDLHLMGTNADESMVHAKGDLQIN